MTKVYRKGAAAPREVEVFELDVTEDDQEALRADPGAFVRDRLGSEIPRINGVTLDVRLVDALSKGLPVSGRHVVHHSVSGEWESWVEVTRKE